MPRFANLLRRFIRDEKGTVLVETVVLLPAFFWVYAGLFAYWDVYRTINTVQKASFTIADLISRSQAPMDDDYLNGMVSTMDYLLNKTQSSKIRVTSYKWNLEEDRYEVIFSRSPNDAMAALTTADLANLTDRLPIMFDGDSAVLLETQVPLNPAMSFGLAQSEIGQFIVTRPRFVPKMCHVSFNC